MLPHYPAIHLFRRDIEEQEFRFRSFATFTNDSPDETWRKLHTLAFERAKTDPRNGPVYHMRKLVDEYCAELKPLTPPE